MDGDWIIKLLEKQDDRLNYQDKRFDKQDEIIRSFDDILRGRNGTPGILEQGRKTLEVLETVNNALTVLSEEHKQNMLTCRDIKNHKMDIATDTPGRLTSDILKALLNNKKTFTTIVSIVTTIILTLATMLGLSTAKLSSVNDTMKKVSASIQLIEEGDSNERNK